jgi:hypothetical protein
MDIQRLLTSCLVAIVFTANALGGEPFTSSSTGADWRSASLEYRTKYCERMAASMQKVKPGVTSTYIFDALQEFYTSDDANITGQKITEIVALSVAMYGN